MSLSEHECWWAQHMAHDPCKHSQPGRLQLIRGTRGPLAEVSFELLRLARLTQRGMRQRSLRQLGACVLGHEPGLGLQLAFWSSQLLHSCTVVNTRLGELTEEDWVRQAVCCIQGSLGQLGARVLGHEPGLGLQLALGGSRLLHTIHAG